MKDAVLKQIAAYISRSFAIKTIFCDGEGAVSTLRVDLECMGITLNTAGPQQHVPLVEAKVRESKKDVDVIYLSYHIHFHMNSWNG